MLINYREHSAALCLITVSKKAIIAILEAFDYAGMIHYSSGLLHLLPPFSNRNSVVRMETPGYSTHLSFFHIIK